MTDNPAAKKFTRRKQNRDARKFIFDFPILIALRFRFTNFLSDPFGFSSLKWAKQVAPSGH